MTQYVITELDLLLRGDEPGVAADDPLPHPETVPVGPFESREAADAWAERQMETYGGGSWAVAPLREPDPPTITFGIGGIRHYADQAADHTAEGRA